ncbi:MAG TPA: PD-(D/E)XK nuclease family protein, partial [Tepidisphaeraceae bacterium]|nr:PD-(D/E)XK nuclease family protein [Tepidisphaeraceae bacterium]
TEEAYRKLHFAFEEAGVAQSQPVLLKDVSRFHAQALATLERSLFRDPIHSVEETDGIELVEAPDRRAEVEAAARGIRSLVMRGLRYRDIGVLARDLGEYHELIATVFPEHGIPYFADRRRAATHHPLMEFLRSLFQIARHDWPHEAVMSLLRTGLAGISLYDADGLENYVLAHRIRGAAGWESAKPWNYRRRTIGAEDADAFAPAEPQEADKLRRTLLERIAPLLGVLRSEQPVDVRTIATEIFNTLDRIDVRQTLATWISTAEQAQQPEQAAEHEQVWLNVTSLFEQMVDLLGDEKMLPVEFHDVLQSGLESFDLALAPPTVDQVLIGQADRTRTHTFKAAFVLGLNEGEFPRAGTGGSILNDRDRRTLRRRRIDLSPDLQQRLFDERRLAYLAFTRGSDKLFVCRSLSDDEGRPARPSAFWHRIEALFPAVRTTERVNGGMGVTPVLAAPSVADRPHGRDTHATGQPSSTSYAPDISTPRQLVTSLMHWVRSSPDPLKDSANVVLPSLYQWLASRKVTDDAIGTARRLAWPALSYSNEAALSPAVAGELFHSPLRARVSELETFAACPFRHFARFVLGLKEREQQEVTIQDLGHLYHDLLESGLREVLRRRAEGDRSVRLDQAIDSLIEQIGSGIREELMLSSARNRYLLERARRTSRQIAAAQREMLKRGSFRPAHIGIRFGEGGNLPALGLTTPGGGEVLLEGKIDRVDRIDANNDVAVIDYRLGPGRLPVGMVLHGLSLQLLSHLLVLEANGQRLTGRELQPAGAFYLQLIRKLKDVKHPADEPDPSEPKWHLKLKPRGLFDRRCLPALDRELSSGWSDVVQAYVKQDGSLGHRHNCDASESDEFRTILNVAAARIGELADGILSGRIDIAPYRLKDNSPCPRCEYRPVCRFDSAINKYNHLTQLAMEDVLARRANGGANG